MQKLGIKDLEGVKTKTMSLTGVPSTGSRPQVGDDMAFVLKLYLLFYSFYSK